MAGGSSSRVASLRLGISLLGPVEVTIGGQPRPFPKLTHRILLAILVNADGRVVPASSLIEELWHEDSSPQRRKNLQTHVYQLRRELRVFEPDRAADRIVTRPPGYRLTLADCDLDLHTLDALVAAAREATRRGNPQQAGSLYRQALALWRGPALADVHARAPCLGRLADRLEEQRIAVLEERIDVDLAAGLHADIVPELSGLIAEHPLRERLRARLVLSLYRSGRQADALRAYQDARRILVEELGLDPSAELQDLHRRILNGDSDIAAVEPRPDSVAGSPSATQAGVSAEARRARAGSRPGSATPGALSTPTPPVPRELPALASHFTGRGGELAKLTRLLEEHTPGTHATVLITAIGGMAGVGKTALAVRWAHLVAGRFPDGQLYVNLRGYDLGPPVAAADALAGFLRSLGVPGTDIPADAEERAARYRSLLARRRVLVLLDNAREADEVRLLLPGSPESVVVVTSRDDLVGLVARDGAHRLRLGLFTQADAVGLLRALIGARVDKEPDAAVELARQCCRLPLALRLAAELAAARPDDALADLARELSHHHRVLDILDAGADERTAIRSVFSWSYRQLDAATALAFSHSGLHPGPSLDAYAVAALAGSTLELAERALMRLTRTSLMHPQGSRRYGMHDLLRDYARDVAITGHGQAACRAALSRLLDYYAHAATDAAHVLFPADNQAKGRLPERPAAMPLIADRSAALGWLDAERAVLVAVTAYAAEHGWPDHAVRLAATLFRYLHFGGHVPEAVIVHAHAKNAAALAGDRWGEATALVNLGTAEQARGEYETARDCLRQAQQVFGDIDDRAGQARALVNLSGVDLAEGRTERAARQLEEALVLTRRTGNQVSEARTLANLSNVDLLRGDYLRAEDHLQHALALSDEMEDEASLAHIHNNLGLVYLRQHRYSEASLQLHGALALARSSGNHIVETAALTSLGLVELGQGNSDAATEHLEKALAQAVAAADPTAEAKAWTGLGEILLATRRPDAARDKCATALAQAYRIDKYEQARAHDLMARACEASGMALAARQHWRHALELYATVGAHEADQLWSMLSADGGHH